MLHFFLSGAILMVLWAIGLFFVRFWRKTRDRLFLAFAIAFWCLGLERIAALTLPLAQEKSFYIYGFRLVAFVIIIAAIIEKNCRQR